MQRFIVSEIETSDNGHKRLAHMLDTKSGEEYTMTFGDSISEARIRLMAPSLIQKEKKQNRRKRYE